MSTPVAAAPAPPTVTALKPDPFVACDRCGSAGLWRVVFAAGELVFCGHHALASGFVKEGESHAAYQEENKQRGSN